MTFFDAEINAAYTRQRIADIRALSCHAADVRHVTATEARREALRVRVGAGLIALGQWLSRRPVSGRLPAPTVAGRLS